MKLKLIQQFIVLLITKIKKNNFELIKLMAEDGNIDKIMKDNITSKNYYHHKISIQTDGMLKKRVYYSYFKLLEYQYLF